MAEQNRKSRIALVEETTAGTSVLPTAGTEYLAQQEGYSLVPSFEELENSELRSSIGQAKSILGVEQPTFSMEHYLRHSGVEGTAPGYKLLIESLFGLETIRTTERDVVSASAGTSAGAATITVDTAEGTEFSRGDLLLIKDGTNGFKLRNVLSVSGDVLTLAWNLGTAPAAAVNLGKNVKYSPADSGHPTLSVWEYRANGAAIEHIAGTRVSEGVFTLEAGQLINTAYTAAGTNFKLNPIEITATDTKFDFTDDGGTVAATVAAGVFKDPEELRAALQTAVDDVSTDTIEVGFNDENANAQGFFSFSNTSGATLSLLWNTGANAANTIGDKIGFSVAADDTGALDYTADNALDYSSPQTPSLDSADPLVAKNNEVFIGGFNDNVCVPVQTMAFTVSNELVDVRDICAETGLSEKLVSQRTVTVDTTFTLTRHESKKFSDFRQNNELALAYHFGEKSGGNWVAGKSGSLYVPTCTMTSYEHESEDDVVVVNASFKAFVDADGNGEVYLNFV